MLIINENSSIDQIIDFLLIESKFQFNNLNVHANKHKEQYTPDMDERFTVEDLEDFKKFRKKFDEIADKLSKQMCTTPDRIDDPSVRYVGFISKSGNVVKYDKKYKDFVIYSENNNTTISMYKLLTNREKKNQIIDTTDHSIFKTKVKNGYASDIK